MPSPDELARMDREGFYRGSDWEQGQPSPADQTAAVKAELQTRLEALEAELHQREADTKNKKTPWISIDTETTGLEADWCQVLEIGAVLEDWSSPVEELKRFHCYVYQPDDRYVGQPYALQLNARILKRIAEREQSANDEFLFLTPNEVAFEFAMWVRDICGLPHPNERAFIPGGKNFGGFDRAFLKKLPGWDNIKMRHRAIDPGMLFWNPDIDQEPPSTETCMKRAGLDPTVKHEAIADAEVVIKLVRYAYVNRPAWTDKDIAKGLIATILDKAAAKPKPVYVINNDQPAVAQSS